jgi:hypothetical protein
MRLICVGAMTLEICLSGYTHCKPCFRQLVHCGLLSEHCIEGQIDESGLFLVVALTFTRFALHL